MDDQCLFCRHFRADADGEDVGECRRYPPVMIADEGGEYSAFPLVGEDAGCGEFVRRVS